MTYTAEQLREEATQLERENCDVMKVDQRTQIALLRAHAAALEELARVKAPVAGEIAEVARKLRDWKQFRTKPMPLAHYFVAGCEAADLLESLAAKVTQVEAERDAMRVCLDAPYNEDKRRRVHAEAALAESERKCERLKFHAEAMAKGMLDDGPANLWAAYDAYRAEFKEES